MKFGIDALWEIIEMPYRTWSICYKMISQCYIKHHKYAIIKPSSISYKTSSISVDTSSAYHFPCLARLAQWQENRWSSCTKQFLGSPASHHHWQPPAPVFECFQHNLRVEANCRQKPQRNPVGRIPVQSLVLSKPRTVSWDASKSEESRKVGADAGSFQEQVRNHACESENCRYQLCHHCS